MWTQRSVSANDPMLQLLSEMLRPGGFAGSESDASAFVRAIRGGGPIADALNARSPAGTSYHAANANIWVPPSLHADGFPVFDDEELPAFEEHSISHVLSAYDRRLADQVHMEGPAWPVEIWA